MQTSNSTNEMKPAMATMSAGFAEPERPHIYNVSAHLTAPVQRRFPAGWWIIPAVVIGTFGWSMIIRVIWKYWATSAL